MLQKNNEMKRTNKMTVKELHDKATELAQTAYINKINGRFRTVKTIRNLFLEACKFEELAARKAKSENIGEPTISVLFKGAAQLAVYAGQKSEAERLIREALEGDPPIEIAQELRAMLDKNQKRKD
jgi:Tfp pilus assembly protein PilF